MRSLRPKPGRVSLPPGVFEVERFTEEMSACETKQREEAVAGHPSGRGRVSRIPDTESDAPQRAIRVTVRQRIGAVDEHFRLRLRAER